MKLSRGLTLAGIDFIADRITSVVTAPAYFPHLQPNVSFASRIDFKISVSVITFVPMDNGSDKARG